MLSTAEGVILQKGRRLSRRRWREEAKKVAADSAPTEDRAPPWLKSRGRECIFPQRVTGIAAEVEASVVDEGSLIFQPPPSLIDFTTRRRRGGQWPCLRHALSPAAFPLGVDCLCEETSREGQHEANELSDEHRTLQLCSREPKGELGHGTTAGGDGGRWQRGAHSGAGFGMIF